MIPSIILLVLGAAMSIVFIVSKVINYSLKTIIFKTVASLFFVALGILDFCLNPDGYFFFKLFTVLGLFFGMLGDFFLGFKYITSGKAKKAWILIGMFAFALGHVFYIVGVLTGFYFPGEAMSSGTARIIARAYINFNVPENTFFLIFPFVLPILFIAIYMVIAKKVGINFGKGMLPFGIFYLYCLSSMVFSSLFMAILHGFSKPTLIMFLVGAVFFASSDMMLTGAYFKEGKRSGAYMATYSVFYYIAQFVIAFSIFFLV